jgi:UDP-3-O-[3-hydroxymyristoyl] glucosamine N-acyltransferase
MSSKLRKQRTMKETKLTFKLGEIAEKLEGELKGDPDLLVEGIAPLDQAGPKELSFLSNPRYKKSYLTTKAAAVLVGKNTEPAGKTVIVVPDPYLAFARTLSIFNPPDERIHGIDPLSSVSGDAAIGKEVSLYPFSYIGPGVRIGDRVTVHPNSTIMENVEIGEGTVIFSNVTIYPGTVVGRRVRIHGGSVIGSDGFGYVRKKEGYEKIPQTGNVVIEDDVEIGACVTIDRASIGATRIGRGTKIDNLVQIGHSVQIGRNVVLVSQVGISGSTKIGDDVLFAGQSGAAGHLKIGDRVKIGAKSAVINDVPDDSFVTGIPALEHGTWKRAKVIFAKLPELRKRVKKLEGTLGRSKNGPEEVED